MGRRKIIEIVILVVILVVILTLNNPRVRGYFQSQERLEKDLLQERYERVVSSLTFELPEKPNSEKTFDMPNFLTPEATCYYDAGANVASYMENISYNEFIWYGRPLMFQHYDGEYGVRVGPLRGELSNAAFYNLGYEKYCGNTRGTLPVGVIDVVSYHNVEMNELINRDLGGVADYMDAEDIVESYDNYIFFKTGREALTFIKKLMSTDRPLIITVKDWSRIGHFQTLFGYNETHIISPGIAETPKIDWIEKPLPKFYEEPLNDTYKEKFTYKEFLEKIWGPKGHSFCWFDKTESGLSEKEIFILNKKDALEAPQNIQKVINGNYKYKRIEDIPGNGAIAVAAASRYLKKQGYNKLADKYMEIANTYYDMRKSGNIDLVKIKKLYQEAADVWRGTEF